MCVAVPMKLVEVEGQDGRAESGGVRCNVRLDLVEEAAVGQYVLVHAGYVLQLLDEDDALETLHLLAELGEAALADDATDET